jgi:hypothetical protein
MLKKLAVLAIGVALAVGANARADQLTTNITLQNVLTGVGPVASAGSLSSPVTSGLSYTTTTQPLTVPGGGVFATGATLLQGYTLIGGGVGTIPNTTDQIVLTYAIQGNQTSAGGAPGLSASFNKGVIAIYDTGSVAGTRFNPANPATWGPTGGLGTLLYSASIQVPPGTTGVGINPAGLPGSGVSAANQNLAAFNTTAAGTQGNFVFDNHFILGGAKQPFSPPNPFSGFQIQVSEFNAGPPNSVPGAASPGDAALDTNFNTVAGLIAAQGMSASPFTATGFTASFNLGNPLVTGDTIQTIGFNLFPFETTSTPVVLVPEPMSMLLWAGIAAGFGVYRRVRRTRAAA